MTAGKRGRETVADPHRFPPFPHHSTQPGKQEGGRFPLDPPLKGGRRGNEPLPQSGGFRGETNRGGVASVATSPDLAYLALLELACRELDAEDRQGPGVHRREPQSQHSPPRRQSAPPRRQSAQRRLGCPGCGQGRGLDETAAGCGLCGWSVGARVARRWTPENAARLDARAYELARDGEPLAERIAFEDLRGECDGLL